MIKVKKSKLDAIQNETKKKNALRRLEQIDMECVRPLRAVLAGNKRQQDVDKLYMLDNEAEILREKLKGGL